MRKFAVVASIRAPLRKTPIVTERSQALALNVTVPPSFSQWHMRICLNLRLRKVHLAVSFLSDFQGVWGSLYHSLQEPFRQLSEVSRRPSVCDDCVRPSQQNATEDVSEKGLFLQAFRRL